MKLSWRHLLLLAIAAGALVALAVHAPISQDLRYHAFADQRRLFGVANFWNVVSNIPFVVVGLAGLRAIRKRKGTPEMVPACAIFFAGGVLVGFGSAWYHLAPSNATLVWDRLPMTISFMAFFAIVIGESISAALARRMLPWLLLAGAASVFYWRWTDDLRPYAAVQFLPMLLVPLILLLFPPRSLRAGWMWALIVAYGAAKGFELFDAEIYAASRFVSGHTLKHLAAAAGMACVIPVRKE